MKNIEEHMSAVHQLAKSAGVSREEILQMWDLMWEESR